MKITKHMKRQIRATARANGVTPDKRVNKKEYAPTGQRMRKTISYSFEEGCLVTILDTAPTYEEPNITGIVIGQHPTHPTYFEVLMMDGKLLNILGGRLRKAD
jgi:hypothetical protein